MRRCLQHDELLRVEQASEMMIYSHNLACHDYYLTQEQFDSEAKIWATVPKPYVDHDGTHESFSRWFREFWISELIQETKNLRFPVTWDKFNDMLYYKMPGGSCGLPKPLKLGEVGQVVGIDDIGGCRLSGNKRLQSELMPTMHFALFGMWVVHTFLMYEVTKEYRYLYPAGYDYTKLGLYTVDHMYSECQNWYP